MARDKISEYDATASSNTVVSDVNIAEGCPPSGINDAIRQVMAALKRFQTGADGDTISAPVFIGTTASITTANIVNAAVSGTATFNGATIMSSSLSGTTANFSGATTIGGAAVLSSTANIAGATTIGGAAVLSSTLDVTGASTFSTANITGATTIGGAAVLSSTANITGATTIGGAAVLSSTANITGATTIGGAAVLSSTLAVTGASTFSSTSVFGGTANFQDNSVQRPTLLDYCVKGSALGSVGTLATVDMTAANFFSATLGSACTFVFSNPCGSGDFGGFVMELTNGGSATVTWPASVDWAGGSSPTLTSSGKDLLVFVTRDAGTTYHGMAASIDSK